MAAGVPEEDIYVCAVSAAGCIIVLGCRGLFTGVGFLCFGTKMLLVALFTVYAYTYDVHR